MIWKLIPHFRKRKTGTSWELLEKVIEAIKAEPRRINMSFWAGPPNQDVVGPACGTQGCIAGWMNLMTAPNASKVDYIDASSVANKMLPPSVFTDAQRLFHGSPMRNVDGYDIIPYYRPYPFPATSDGVTLKDQRRYARQVIANIRKFMSAHRAELKAHKINMEEVYGPTTKA